MPVWIVAATLSTLGVWLCGTTSLNVLSGDDMVFDRSYTTLATLFSAPIENYMTWTARLSNVFSLNVIFALTSGEFLESFTLIFSVGILALSLAILMSRIFVILRFSNPGIKAYTLSLATTLCLCLYSTTTYENFYWMAGVVTYVLPLAGFNFTAAYLLNLPKRTVRIHRYIILYLASLFVGLFNEAFVIQTVLVSILLIIPVSLFYRSVIKKYFSLVATGVAGFITAGAVMKVAPGTAYRSELNASLAPDNFDHSYIALIKMASSTSVNEFSNYITANVYGIMLVSLIAILYMLNTRDRQRFTVDNRKLVAVAFWILTLPLFAFYSLSLGVHYAYQPSITSYSLLTANYFGYLSAISFWVTILHTTHLNHIRRIKAARYIATVLILLTCIPAALRITQIYDLGKKQQAESNEIKKIVSMAIRDGKSSVSVGTSERYFTYCMPEPDPNTWCNKAYSQYYGITVRADRYIDHSKNRGVQL
ncbi:hypothetical protein [Dokdonella sp.]|uniref:hypothetical protein n=1 Tax=Dokdonella sp. TaxID=2291710 RepID=UPI0031BECFEB|nr:hypothetical protein [Dokdonella sp.]